ncbi:AAA family ATPase [Methylobacillus sp. Pita2]|uniref:AAA family ATPase n=1 Tax=Methylobacillus sp. Pita2 TaxID=3383245 RepID=UPI0038B637D8
MAVLQTKIKSKVFERGMFAIFRLDDGNSIAGELPAMKADHLIGAQVRLEGDWESNKFGDTFKFTSLMLDEDRVVHFLNKMVGYISRPTAMAINKEFGEEGTWEVLNNAPEKLLEFNGIGPKKLEKIKASWAAVKPMWMLGKILTPLGVTPRQIEMINEHFGDRAIETLEKDPYAIVAIRGIGFKVADEIAIKVGVSLDSPMRLKACAEYSIRDLMDSTGNTALKPSAVIEKMKACIADTTTQVSDDKKYESALLDSLNARVISFLTAPADNHPDRITADDPVALWGSIENELVILRAARNLVMRGPIVEDIEKWITNYEAKECKGKPFGDQQKDAIRLANQMPSLFSISGYAGTGKTTTSKAILKLICERHNPDDIACCALAGVAANRIKMQSGFESSTIHSLLGWDGTGGFEFDKNNKLPHSVILLDESTMNDSWLLAQLFSAIDFKNTTLIMLGDPGQIDPVGPGQPYADLIKLDLIPNVTLSKIYRTEEGMVIPVVAESVRNCRTPDLTGSYKDFGYTNISIEDYMRKRRVMSKDEMAKLRDENNIKIRDKTMDIAITQRGEMRTKLRNGDPWGYITHLQVISPMKKGTIGVAELNKHLQHILNPTSGQLEVHKASFNEFRVNDKVVHLKNKDMTTFPKHAYKGYRDGKDIDDVESTIKVFNGQQGLVIGATDEEVHVYFPIEDYVCVYESKHINSGMLDLSYCLTTHKTQGSEYSYVVLPTSLSHFNMLSPRMLYTGMTRAKQRLDIVGQLEAIQASCNPKMLRDRETCIQEIVKQAMKIPKP